MKCGTKRMKAGGPTGMDRAKYGKNMAKVANQSGGLKKGGAVKMAAGGMPNAKAMQNANAKAGLAGRFGMKKGGAVRGMGAATKGAGKGPWG